MLAGKIPRGDGVADMGHVGPLLGVQVSLPVTYTEEALNPWGSQRREDDEWGPESVALSLLCLGRPCFRFRGFEKSWLGWRWGWQEVILGSVGILGAPTAGKNTWSGTQGVSPKGRARCTRTQSQCWGHLRPQETSSEAVLTSLLAGSGVR